MKNLRARAAGFSLIEVMIAVVVLAAGLVSLAALQGRLFQSGAESKARAAATAIAQQTLEEARSFAFVTAPVNADGTITYTGTTYASLASGTPQTVSSGNMGFTVTRSVMRYRYSAGAAKFVANTTDPYSVGVPEFKQVDIDVTWTGSDGANKSVKMTDSIAAVAPADAARLRRRPGEQVGGPKVYVARPSDPQILPIALGDDQEAASSNPKPNQIIQDVAAATTFSVMTYSGTGDTVLLGRKVDMAAVSCVCQAGPNASVSNPAYQPVVWNGRQQAYLEPLALVDSTVKTGVPNSKLDNSEIKQMCTVCCRDHHETVKRSPRPDPWRVLADAEKPPSGQEHYGYAAKGSNYDMTRLRLLSESGVSSYVDSCQLIRVGGRLRLAVDARQANLLVTPINSDQTSPYDVVDFKNKYGTFVQSQIAANIGGVSGGGFPGFVVPKGSNLRLPGPIRMDDSSPEKKLVAFGMYMDYLSQETLDAYGCVAGTIDSSDSRCRGLTEGGSQAAMAMLPFYAVNVANLGEWRSAERSAINVYSADHAKGTDGGRVIPNRGKAVAADGTAVEIPVTLRMNASNTGLASTFPVDPDDASAGSFREDHQDFIKDTGEVVSSYTINFEVAISDGVNLSRYNFLGATKNVTCEGRFSVSCTVTYTTATLPEAKVNISGYNTSTMDRRICVAKSDNSLGVKVSVTGAGTASEESQITVPGSFKLDDPEKGVVTLAVVQGDVCPSDYF